MIVVETVVFADNASRFSRTPTLLAAWVAPLAVSRLLISVFHSTALVHAFSIIYVKVGVAFNALVI